MYILITLHLYYLTRKIVLLLKSKDGENSERKYWLVFDVRESAVNKRDMVLGFNAKTKMENRHGGKRYPKKYRCYKCMTAGLNESEKGFS